MRRPRLTAAAVLALVLLLAPASALAACPRTSVADVEDEVMCGVCKTPLALAQEAPQANRERAFILERVERCQSKGQIKAALAAEFGKEVLALPQREGFDLAVYIVPLLALAGGLGACALAVGRWRRGRTATSAPGAALVTGERAGANGHAPGAVARLERDLERYDL